MAQCPPPRLLALDLWKGEGHHRRQQPGREAKMKDWGDFEPVFGVCCVTSQGDTHTHQVSYSLPCWRGLGPPKSPVSDTKKRCYFWGHS